MGPRRRSQNLVVVVAAEMKLAVARHLVVPEAAVDVGDSEVGEDKTRREKENLIATNGQG